MTIPEITLTDPEVLADPFAAYRAARERAPLVRLLTPGFGSLLAVTRHETGRALLADPRFEINAASFLRPDVPADCLPYLHTMSEMDGPNHARLRRLVAPAFSARRAAEFRPRIERIVHALLDELPGQTDLLDSFAKPLPMAVICELVGIPEADRPDWREWGAAVASGDGKAFGEAIPGIIAGARKAVGARRDDPTDDLLSDLVQARAEDGDRLTETELITLVWHLVLAGQTPTNMITNAVPALLDHPDQLTELSNNRAAVVAELLRWCGPQLLTVPRYAREEVEIEGTRIARGEPVSVAIGAANRDPEVFADPERFDVRRGGAGHLSFAHGAHFCLGAALAREEIGVAISFLWQRFPRLRLAGELVRVPDPGTWRVAALPVALKG